MNIYQLDTIETPRLIIRPIQSGDEIELNNAVNRSLSSLQQWMPWAHDPSFQTTKDFVNRAVIGWQSGNASEWPMAVINKQSGKIIAASGFNNHSAPIIPCYEIGYWIDSQYQGQGLVTEYVTALSFYAFRVLKAQRLQICSHVDNQKSRNVAQRCGFTPELIMKNYQLDCTTNQLASSILYSCCDRDDLLSLEVSWHEHNKPITSNYTIIEQAKSTDPIPLKPLETKRLKLIPPKIEDAQKVHHAIIGSINELAPFFSWATFDNLKRDEVARHIKEDAIAAADIKAHTELFYFVWDKEQNSFLGEVWLKVLDWSVMSADCGYWFDTRQTGRGYAREAVARLVKYAFDDLNAKRISIDVSIENKKSLKLPPSLNFTFEGIIKNNFRNFITNKPCDGTRFAITDPSQLKYAFVDAL